MKIKNPPKELQVGDFCEVVLTKVQSDEIKADFKSMKVLKTETGEQQAIGIFDSVLEESLKDIEAAKNVGSNDEPDLNTEIVDRA